MVSSGISDAVFASVHSEKTRLMMKMMMMMMMIIKNKSQETMDFSGCQKLTSVMKLRPEKWWQTSNLMLYKSKSS